MDRDTPPPFISMAEGFKADAHTTILAPLYGIRAFEVSEDAHLTGVAFKAKWPADGPAIAKCYNPGRRPKAKIDPHGGSSITVLSSGAWLVMPSAWMNTVDSEILPGPTDRSHNMKDCACGLWAYYSQDHTDRYGNIWRPNAVVAGQGRAVAGTKGFRVVNARIVALTKPEALTVGNASHVIPKTYMYAMEAGDYAEMVARMDAAAAKRLAEFSDRWDALVARYRVPVYDDIPTMLAAHPLSTGIEHPERDS